MEFGHVEVMADDVRREGARCEDEDEPRVPAPGAGVQAEEVVVEFQGVDAPQRQVELEDGGDGEGDRTQVRDAADWFHDGQRDEDEEREAPGDAAFSGFVDYCYG